MHSVNVNNSLVALALSDNNLGNASLFPWLFHYNQSLGYIDLSGTNSGGRIPDALTHMRFLYHLDLRENAFEGLISEALGNFTYVSYLDLSNNHLTGPIGDSLCLPNLEVLDLSQNNLSGRIPNLSSCSSLRSISLRDNMFNGTLTESIGNLFKLEYLDLSKNHLGGLISEAHLFSLPNLRVLLLSFNSNFTMEISSSWEPRFQLNSLGLINCHVGSHFPRWLHNQRNIEILDISIANISDIIPSWFWNNIQKCFYLNMSHNQIHGFLPSLSSKIKLVILDLSFNQFNVSPPPLPPGAKYINLSGNKFSGTIINICNSTDYDFLDLSNNLLSGKIFPDCFLNLTTGYYLNLANNNLSGNLETDNSTCNLFSISLRNNSFTGNIPKSLMKCHDLNYLDLGENNFYGHVSSWLGESLPQLSIIILKSNQFHGSLSSSLCRLSKIQVLDISMNKISGTIPKCVHNFTMLSSKENPLKGVMFVYRPDIRIQDSAIIIWKGKDAKYMSTLSLLKVIDLSVNNLSGKIPHEITKLVGLLGLNLSRNNLVGTIPRDIGQLEFLNFLDLSQNNLAGNIPSTLSQLNQLGFLNLSFNNLSGKIPYDFHMDTFAAYSYTGNPRLCGPPLESKPCLEEREMPKKPNFLDGIEKQDCVLKHREFYISMVLGFIISFWGAFGSLYFNKRWSKGITKVFISLEDWLYVKILVNKARHV